MSIETNQLTLQNETSDASNFQQNQTYATTNFGQNLSPVNITPELNQLFEVNQRLGTYRDEIINLINFLYSIEKIHFPVNDEMIDRMRHVIQLQQFIINEMVNYPFDNASVKKDYIDTLVSFSQWADISQLNAEIDEYFSAKEKIIKTFTKE